MKISLVEDLFSDKKINNSNLIDDYIIEIHDMSVSNSIQLRYLLSCLHLSSFNERFQQMTLILILFIN